MPKRAVILLNMGGPRTLEEIPAYLENIFNDPNIIDIPVPGFLRKPLVRRIVKKRIPKTTAIYKQIDGGSPLNLITEQQAKALEKRLNELNQPDINVFYAMSYTRPFFPEIWETVEKGAYDQVILLSLYPHFSTTTTGSCIKQWLKVRENGPQSFFIKSFYDHLAYIEVTAKHIESYIKTNSVEGEEAVLLFSAHGIPVSRVKKGDPYPDEINRCIDAIADRFPQNIETYLGFQSKVGPVRWLEPETSEVIKILAEQGIEKLFVYPISFVADNSESLYEIDILFRNKALSYGVDIFHTIPCLNTDDSFIGALAAIIGEAINGELDERYLVG